MEERGVVTIAIGRTYREMAVKSIASLRKFYDGPIFVISDADDRRMLRLGATIKVVPYDKSFGTRIWKTQVGLVSPFKHSIFVDCDVLAVNSFDRMWYEPHEADIGLCQDMRPTLDEAAYYSTRHYRYDPCEVNRTLEMCGMATTHHNSGIFTWKHGHASRHLFQAWHCEWGIFKKFDQFALARALAQTEADVRVMPLRYNTSPAKYKTSAAAADAGIVFLHFWGQTKKQFLEYV